MIRRIEALGYRCLRDVSQWLAPFQMLVGPNASGKSTFLDCVGFLGDLLNVGPVAAILGNGTHAARAADPRHLCWMEQRTRFEISLDLEVPKERLERLKDPTKFGFARYEVAIDIGTGQSGISIAGENLFLTPRREPKPREQSLFPMPPAPRESIVRVPRKQTPQGWRKVVSKIAESGNDYFQAETSGWNNPFRLGPTKSALANLPEDEERFPIATWVKRFLMEGLVRIELDAEAMRRPSPPGLNVQFIPDGSNLPWVVENLRTTNPASFADWVDHVRTALPDLRNVRTVERPEDRHRYLMLEYVTGLSAPSWVVSDGTLRLLALTLLPYLPPSPTVYLVEEPENGIHPRAVETVFQSLSGVYAGQVLCASHSPVVLGLAEPAQLLCFAKDAEGATDIILGSEHPRLRDWQGQLDLGAFFAAGVLG